MISVDYQRAYQTYADELDRTIDSFSNVEKMQAIMNVVLEGDTKTFVVCTEDITDERFGKGMTGSDDKEVHLAYHLRTAMYHIVHQMFPCGKAAAVTFPLTMKMSVEVLRENMNAKLLVKAEVICEETEEKACCASDCGD